MPKLRGYSSSRSTALKTFRSSLCAFLAAGALLCAAGAATADDVTSEEPINIPEQTQTAAASSARWTPFQLALFTKAQILPSHWRLRGLGINLIYGNQDDVRGLVVGLFNVAGDMRGMQLGFVNGSPGLVRGLQLGAANWAEGGVRGMQIGAINMAGGEGSFGQIGVFNQSNKQDGLQLGLYNRSNSLRGAQLGLLNINPASKVFGFLPIFNVGW